MIAAATDDHKTSLLRSCQCEGALVSAKQKHRVEVFAEQRARCSRAGRTDRRDMVLIKPVSPPSPDGNALPWQEVCRGTVS